MSRSMTSLYPKVKEIYDALVLCSENGIIHQCELLIQSPGWEQFKIIALPDGTVQLWEHCEFEQARWRWELIVD